MIGLLQKWRWPILLTIAFGVSRVAYYKAGVRFDAGPLFWFWQYIEFDLLRGDLLRSVYHLHSQPPLFNLYLGVVVKVFGRAARDAFWASYVLTGLVLHLGIYFLAVRLRARPIIAAAVALLFIASPTSVLYENWLFYSYPLATILCLVTLFLHRYLERERTLDGVVLFLLAGAMTLTWGLYAAFWFVGTVLFVGVARRTRGWRHVLGVAAVPLVLIAALYVKNGMLFGTPSTSSWAGMNIAGMMISRLDPADRERLIARGKLSPLSRVDSFMDVKAYDAFRRRPPLRGVPVLDRESKASRIPNYNHLAYVGISKLYLKESWRIIQARPRIYFEAVRDAYLYYALPASDATFLRRNGMRVERFDEICSAVLYGSFGSFTGHRFSFQERSTMAYLTGRVSYFWIAAILATIVFSFAVAWRSFGRRRGASPEAATLLFIAGNILFVTLAGNAFEVTENNRFRFTFDPLVWAAIAMMLSAQGRALIRTASSARSDLQSDAACNPAPGTPPR